MVRQVASSPGFGLTRTIVHQRMSDVPEEWKPRLRELSLGPYEGSMVRWTYHDGSTWVALLFESRTPTPRSLVAWSVLTLQEADIPVIGVFVDPERRGLGYATDLVGFILKTSKPYIKDKILAVLSWWPKYSELIKEAGYEPIEWD